MKNVWRYVLAVVLCEAVGGLGALFTANAIPAWYAHLAKPAFAPPNWLFGPVWTILYALMGIAFVLLHDAKTTDETAHDARTWFYLQLGLNAVWSPVFFGLRNPGAGLVVIVALWLAIIGTVLRAWYVSKASAVLLLPYLAWVSFAMTLNLELWRLN